MINKIVELIDKGLIQSPKDATFKYEIKIQCGKSTIFEKTSKPIEMIGDCLLDAHKTIEELIHQTANEGRDKIM